VVHFLLLRLSLRDEIFLHQGSSGVIVQGLPVKHEQRKDSIHVGAVVNQCRFEGLALHHPGPRREQVGVCSGG